MLRTIHRYGGRYQGELLYMAANYMTPLVGFFASLVATRYVEPAEMGAIQTAMLFLPYLSMLHFGAFNGLNRNLAYYLAQGDGAKAMRMVSASAWVARADGWVGLLFGAGLVVFHALWDQSSAIVLTSAFAVTIMLIATPRINHLSATYRSGQHFRRFGVVTVLDNGFRLIYSLLPALAGWLGYVFSLALSPVTRYVLLKRTEPYPPTVRCGSTDVAELIKVGFPIMALGYCSTLLMVADQSLIALFMTKESLGYYTLARLVINTIGIIPATLSIVISPKVAACYGRTGDPRALRKYYWVILAVHALFVAPFCLVGYFAIGPTVTWLLPKYVQGIAVGKITALSCVNYIFFGLLIITTSLQKNALPMMFYGLALALMWLVGRLLFVYGHPTIESVAWLRFIVSSVLSVVVMVYAYLVTGQKPAHAQSGIASGGITGIERCPG